MYIKKFVLNSKNIKKNACVQPYIVINPYFVNIKNNNKVATFSTAHLIKKNFCRILNLNLFFNFFLRFVLFQYYNILFNEVYLLKKQIYKFKNNYFLFLILLYKIKFSIYKHLMLKLSSSPTIFFSKTRIKRKKIPLVSPFILINKIIQWMTFNVKKLSIKENITKALHKELLNSFIFSFLGYYKLKIIKTKKTYKNVLNRLKRKKVTFTK